MIASSAPTLGLVMEGGGMRGLFTSGVIDVLMEQGISFGCAVGVSAGACFGVNIKSQQIGRALRYNVQMQGNPHYMSLRSLLTTGNYVNAEFCYHTLPDTIDIVDRDSYVRNPMQFHVVCTDVDTGQPVYRRIDQLDYEGLEWIRASASLPGVSRPVCIGGRRLLDGGLSDSVPLRYIEDLGYERNVVILTQPRGYRKRPVRWTWPYRLLCGGGMPEVLRCLKERPSRYNTQMDYLDAQERAGRILLIAPPAPLQIGRIELDGRKLRHIYQLGREACEAQLPALRQLMADQALAPLPK